MKNMLYLLLALLCVTATSCKDEDYDCFSPTGSSSTLPEKVIQGTYPGTFTRTSNGETTSAEGMITITPCDTAYCAFVGFVSAEFSLKDTIRMNVFQRAGGTYSFEVNTVANRLQAKILGFVGADGSLDTSFEYKQRVGRKTTTYQYTFTGKKQ